MRVIVEEDVKDLAFGHTSTNRKTSHRDAGFSDEGTKSSVAIGREEGYVTYIKNIGLWQINCRSIYVRSASSLAKLEKYCKPNAIS